MERIERRNDENLYQPKIHADKIRGLYRIGQETGLPMTVVLDRAIEEFIERYEVQKSENSLDWQDDGLSTQRY